MCFLLIWKDIHKQKSWVTFKGGVILLSASLHMGGWCFGGVIISLHLFWLSFPGWALFNHHPRCFDAHRCYYHYPLKSCGCIFIYYYPFIPCRSLICLSSPVSLCLLFSTWSFSRHQTSLVCHGRLSWDFFFPVSCYISNTRESGCFSFVLGRGGGILGSLTTTVTLFKPSCEYPPLVEVGFFFWEKEKVIQQRVNFLIPTGFYFNSFLHF